MAVLINQLGTPDKRDFLKLDSLASGASTSNWSTGTLAAELSVAVTLAEGKTLADGLAITEGLSLAEDAVNAGSEADDSTGPEPVASAGVEDAAPSKLGKPKSK